MLQGDQLSLFDQLPPPLADLPTHAEVERICTEFLMQCDRPGLVAYLNQLCSAGHVALVAERCRIRSDFGLKVRNGQVVEFFQVGDVIQIYKQGQFFGKIARITTLEQGVATVRGENWVVDHKYPVSEIRLMKRGKDG